MIIEFRSVELDTFKIVQKYRGGVGEERNNCSLEVHFSEETVLILICSTNA